MMVVCVCLALLIGGSYALFSDSVDVNNHLKAGNLKVGLERVSYQTSTIGSDGNWIDGTADTSVVDLTSDSQALFATENAVPGSWYEAKIKVTNKGNVAFDYGMRMLWNTNGEATAEQQELAGQIRMTITYGANNTSVSFMLDESSDVELGRLLSGASEIFTVRAELTDAANNNAVQDISLDFDLQVYATQVVQG